MTYFFAFDSPVSAPRARFPLPLAETTSMSSRRTQFTSSIALQRSASNTALSFTVWIHQESAKTTRARPFGPPRKIGSQSATAGKILVNDSPPRQDGCILTHHCFHAAANSDILSMVGWSSGFLLHFIHHSSSSGREATGNLWVKI